MFSLKLKKDKCAYLFESHSILEKISGELPRTVLDLIFFRDAELLFSSLDPPTEVFPNRRENVFENLWNNEPPLDLGLPLPTLEEGESDEIVTRDESGGDGDGNGCCLISLDSIECKCVILRLDLDPTKFEDPSPLLLCRLNSCVELLPLL
jgi:hypothetical protein